MRKIIQVDRHTIIQILGGLMNKPDLLNETDKYLLEPGDFSQQLDRFIFSAIYNLYINGAEKIHVSDIDNYLKDNSLAKSLMEKENGISFLQDCETQAEINNFNYYYNKLKKINLVRTLQTSKNKIDDIYCEDILNDKYIEINNKFEQLSATDIVNTLKMNLANLENKFVLNQIAEESKAAEGIRDLVVELKEKPEMGCKLQGDIFNTICRGGRKGKLYIRSAGSGVGKAVPNYTKIPTPNGWTTVGEVKVGDYLFDRFGKPTKVLAVYPQEEKKQVYKVYFKSGRIAECCSEHLWSYYSIPHGKKLFTKTLKDIYKETKENGFKKFKKYCFRVPIVEKVEFPKKELLLEPYIMGMILGGGSFRCPKSNKAFMFSSENNILPKYIADKMGYILKRHKTNKYCWYFEHNKESNHKNVWVEEIIPQYPELWNCNSHNKFIPEDYLFSSEEQRLELLRGLLDTNGGFALQNGVVSYTTVSERLKEDFINLVSSLGFLSHLYVEHKEDGRIAYHINLVVDNVLKPNLFKLDEKKQKAIEYLDSHNNIQRGDRKTDPIIKIEPTDNYVDMTCFYVDNKEHLFAINSWCITHNTRSMVGDACNIAYPIRYDSIIGKWVSTGSCEKVLYVMTEQDPEEIKTMILAYLTGYNEEIFLYGTYGEEEMERINIAINIMEKFKDNMLFAKVSDPCSSIVKNLFRRYNLQYGVENFFYDYIFSSPAMLNEYRDLKIQEHVALRMFTTTLKNLAVELNAFVMTSTQLNAEDDPKGGFKDFRNIRGAKSIIDLADFACIMSRPTSDELNQITEFKKSFGFMPNLVTDIFKNRRGRWNMVRIWSYNDLGTCRKTDLFLTTSLMKEATGFITIDFKPYEEDIQFFKDLEKLYNTGEITGQTEKLITLDNNLEIEELDLESAFGDRNDRLNRLKDKELSDLL